jgi:ferredoxin
MFNSYQTNTLKYKPELCNGCSLCVNVCPHGVFTIKDHRAELVNYQGCMECGACQLNCQPGAILVKSGVGCATYMMLKAMKLEKRIPGSILNPKKKSMPRVAAK